MDSRIAITTARAELARCMSHSADTRDDEALTRAARRWFDAIATQLTAQPDGLAVLPAREAFALRDAIDDLRRRHAA